MTNKIIPQRDAFWDKILEKARADKNVIVISADMGAPSLDVIRKELPSQFINVGIAEQNAIIIGAGLALTGKKVFVYAIAPFITIRCLEQIRVECGIMNIPMTIVGVGVGFGYEDSGPTHHLLEDIAMMRCLPNMTIHTMTDSNMSSSFGEIAYESNSPNYIRVYRQTLPDIYDKNHDFRKGLSVLKKSKDYYIVSCGSMTHTAIEVSEKLAKNKIIIVSGLAMGVDATAHQLALNSQTQTVAVLGSGLAWDYLYPASNKNLAKKILEKNGLIFSEFPIFTEGLPFNFPRRNRIIAGLSQATLVAEASIKSGALITAKCALEQNREVMAVPGPINSLNSQGTNWLIQNGAKLIATAADIKQNFGLAEIEIKQTDFDPKQASHNELLILETISVAPLQIDKIIEVIDIKYHKAKL